MTVETRAGFFERIHNFLIEECDEAVVEMEGGNVREVAVTRKRRTDKVMRYFHMACVFPKRESQSF